MPKIKKQWLSWEEFERIQGGTWTPAKHYHTRSDITDFWNSPFWASIPDKPSTFPPSAHALVSATHTASGLTAGHYLRATGATSFAFQAIPAGDLPSHTHPGSDIISMVGNSDMVDGLHASEIPGQSHYLLNNIQHLDTVGASPVKGDLIVGNATPKWERFPGNTATSRKFLSQTGTGSEAALPIWNLLLDSDIPTTCVRTSRSISTTSPLTGGGNLSADRTLGLAGLTGVGTANYLVGVNSAGNAWEYKSQAPDSAKLNGQLASYYLDHANLTNVTTDQHHARAHNVLSADHSDSLPGSVVRGDIIVGNSTPKWARLAKGASGTYLRSNGTDPAWSAIQAGDLPSHTHPGGDITSQVGSADLWDGGDHHFSNYLDQAVKQASNVIFNALQLQSFTTAGFVKNTVAGVLSGGNSIVAGDLPSHTHPGSDITSIVPNSNLLDGKDSSEFLSSPMSGSLDMNSYYIYNCNKIVTVGGATNLQVGKDDSGVNRLYTTAGNVLEYKKSDNSYGTIKVATLQLGSYGLGTLIANNKVPDSDLLDGIHASGFPQLYSGSSAVTIYVGTAENGQVLQYNSGTGRWQNASLGSGNHNLLSAAHPDTLAASVVQGDVIVGNSTPKWARLAGNTEANKKFLTSTGSGTVAYIPAWGFILDADVPTTCVRTSRSISTTSPLTGGGNLSADRTLGLAGLSGVGTANYLVGVNSAGNAWEYKQRAPDAEKLTCGGYYLNSLIANNRVPDAAKLTCGGYYLDTLTANNRVADSDGWGGYSFVNYMNQPVKTTSDVTFNQVTIGANKNLTVGNFGIIDTYHFSGTYRYLLLGQLGATKSLSLGVNLISNPSSQFGGNEIFFPYNTSMLAPNSANDGYIGVLKVRSNTQIDIGSGYSGSGQYNDGWLRVFNDRVEANILKAINRFDIGANQGATGVFESADYKSIVVTGGIITSIS